MRILITMCLLIQDFMMNTNIIGLTNAGQAKTGNIKIFIYINIKVRIIY